MSKKIVITDKSTNALRILSYLNNKKLELKKIVDSKVDLMMTSAASSATKM